MSRRKTQESGPAKALAALASGYPAAQTGISCKGTAIESTTFGVRKKVFLFLRAANGACQLRFKLEQSHAELAKLAAKAPDSYSIGAQGWAKVVFDEDQPPSMTLLKKWIEESYRLMAAPAVKARGRD